MVGKLPKAWLLRKHFDRHGDPERLSTSPRIWFHREIEPLLDRTPNIDNTTWKSGGKSLGLKNNLCRIISRECSLKNRGPNSDCSNRWCLFIHRHLFVSDLWSSAKGHLHQQPARFADPDVKNVFLRPDCTIVISRDPQNWDFRVDFRLMEHIYSEKFMENVGLVWENIHCRWNHRLLPLANRKFGRM